MAKFKVTVTEHTQYTVIVEADNRDDAEDEAESRVLESTRPADEFAGGERDVRTDDCVEQH